MESCAMRNGCYLVTAMASALLAIVHTGCDRCVEAGPHVNLDRVEKIREVLASGAPANSGEKTAAAQTASGWATVRGTFKVVGTAPTPTRINADKDPETCGKHPLVDESVMVSEAGGLQNALVYLRTKVTANPDLASPA